MGSSKFDYSPDSEREDGLTVVDAPASRPPASVDPPWRNEREPVSSADPPAPLSSAPDSMWCDPNEEDDDDEIVDDAPETSPYPWSPQPAPDSSAADSTAPASSCASSRTPESVLVHSSGDSHTTRTAAAHMGITPKALTRMCCNAQDANGVADLGGGIMAFKVGRFWRIRFPWWQ